MIKIEQGIPIAFIELIKEVQDAIRFLQNLHLPYIRYTIDFTLTIRNLPFKE